LTHKELAKKIVELEQKIGKNETDIRSIVEAIRQLMIPPQKPKREIGFHVKEPTAKYGKTKRAHLAK
jgi:hypothetical protein